MNISAETSAAVGEKGESISNINMGSALSDRCFKVVFIIAMCCFIRDMRSKKLFFYKHVFVVYEGLK